METTTKETPIKPKKTSLFEIGEELSALVALIEELEGDITDPQVDAAITAWLTEIDTNRGAKVDNYINLIRLWQMQAAAAKAECDQYNKIVRVRENRVERMKERLMLHMQTCNLTKIETPTGRTVAIQKNGGVAPLIIKESILPTDVDEAYQKKIINIDTNAVRAAIEAGTELPWARIGERGVSLRIR